MQNAGLVLAIGLALIHTFATRLNIFTLIPEFRWVSFAGGVSLGYVFLEIFPELSHAQQELEHSAIGWVAYLENHVYVLALLGLLAFYGLDALALKSRRLNRAEDNSDRTSPAVFWIHIGGFAGLNAIFGYLLQDLSDHTWLQCLLFFIAAALHFFIIDFGLKEHHKTAYEKRGRWLLTAAVLAGAVVGRSSDLNEAAISIIWSFLAGSIILNILKHELPDERENCLGSFVGGTVLYASLILLI